MKKYLVPVLVEGKKASVSERNWKKTLEHLGFTGTSSYEFPKQIMTAKKMQTASLLSPNYDKILAMLQKELLLCLQWTFCLTVL